MQAVEAEQAEPAGREEAATEAAGAAAACDNEQEHDEEGSEEAEDSSSDSEADRREFGIYQALPVDEGEPDWDAECLDVQEYLRRVRWAGRQAAAGGGGRRAESCKCRWCFGALQLHTCGQAPGNAFHLVAGTRRSTCRMS